MSGSEGIHWDDHWKGISRRGSVFGWASSIVRRTVFEPSVRDYARRFFDPKNGFFVEAGCGTAESSQGLRADGRSKLGVDISIIALLLARRNLPELRLVQADLRRLPFRDDSVTGIWNLGVLEHFHPHDGADVLAELARVLRPGGHLVLFWPPVFGSSRLLLAPVEWILSTLQRRTFRFFPDEVNRLRSRMHGRRLLMQAGLLPVAVEVPLRLLFIHAVLVGKKPHP